MREGRYWESSGEKLCRVCEAEEETWEHVMEQCWGAEGEDRGIGERVRVILHEGGGGEAWLKEFLSKEFGDKKWGEGEDRRMEDGRRQKEVNEGNEMREDRYWESSEEKLCIVCEAEEETWEHVMERCRRAEGEDRVIGERASEILHEGVRCLERRNGEKERAERWKMGGGKKE